MIMKLKQLPRCLIGRHLRDHRHVRTQGDAAFSRCVGCGVKMVKTQGQWRTAGGGHRWQYAVLGVLCLVFLFGIQRLYAAAHPSHDLVVFLGDSITEGVAASDPLTTSRPGLYQVHAGNAVIVANEGVNGITLGSIAGLVDLKNYYKSGRRNVVVLHGGSNDFAQDAKAVPLFKILQDYARKLKDDGWIVGVGTVMVRNGLLPGQERERQAFNRMIVQGPLKSQGIAVLDFDAAQRAGQVPLADGVHPTDVGYAGMSKLDAAFVDKALAKP